MIGNNKNVNIYDDNNKGENSGYVIGYFDTIGTYTIMFFYQNKYTKNITFNITEAIPVIEEKKDNSSIKQAVKIYEQEIKDQAIESFFNVKHHISQTPIKISKEYNTKNHKYLKEHLIQYAYKNNIVVSCYSTIPTLEEAILKSIPGVTLMDKATVLNIHGFGIDDKGYKIAILEYLTNTI
jgi:hypothetical protein